MSNQPDTPTPSTTTTAPRANLAPILLAWILALAAAGAAIYQNQAATNLQYENGALTAKLESTQAELERSDASLERVNTRLEDARAQVLDLTAQVARIDPEYAVQLEQALAEAEAQVATLQEELDAGREELDATRQALAAKEAEVAELASNRIPPPPSVEVLAPPPLYSGGADYGDPHADVPLDQYLTELLNVLSDDSKAPQLASVHPLGVLYDLDEELLLQGTVGDSQRYRLTEWHTLNEYQDIVLDSLVIIDAPEGVNAITRVQQALTSTRGPAENNESGLLTWEVGTKTITLHPQPGDATRASLHISDSYQLPEVMQVYNRP